MSEQGPPSAMHLDDLTTAREVFQERGYVHLGREEARIDLPCVEQQLNRLARQAEDKLAGRPEGEAACRESGLIVVPEAGDSRLLCRIEYLAGASLCIRDELGRRLATLVEGMIGQPITLFKDKCNFKHPGGGGFPAHQDITAYHHFGTRYQVTVAVMLDPAAALNGGLEMASHWDTTAAGARLETTPRGPLPMLPSYQGGHRNGDIVDELSNQMKWELIEAAPGDIILFDSYVPHRSQPNRSHATRRILFFTFNLADEGDRYQAYYHAKRSAPDDPIFHVSTPTVHSALDTVPKQDRPHASNGRE
jgi:hypothetical protein